jgi:putative restriction endonuclease
VTPGRYLAVWPVYVINDDLAGLCFKITVDEFQNLVSDDQPAVIAENSDARRAYLTSIVRVRLHQRSFRERVLDAYRSRCSFCRLRHRELLDAAHIVPDSERESKPIVENGISLCKLHHAAFDGLFLAVSPDYQIVVREDILEEEDGPGLQHGLKDLHGLTIMLPQKRELWPKKEFLEWRFDRFSKAAS